MGDPIKRRKSFSRPRKPWDKSRLESEQKIKKNYGLKSKRELWKTEAVVRRKRQSARKLLALPIEQREKAEKDIIGSLNRSGLLQSGAIADDILGLNVSEVLERRLQTIVLRKGLANSLKQARQFITHGHIAVNNQKVTTPAYPVRKDDSITYYGKPMVLKVPKKEELKKEFEKAIPKKEENENVKSAETEKTVSEPVKETEKPEEKIEKEKVKGE